MSLCAELVNPTSVLWRVPTPPAWASVFQRRLLLGSTSVLLKTPKLPALPHLTWLNTRTHTHQSTQASCLLSLWQQSRHFKHHIRVTGLEICGSYERTHTKILISKQVALRLLHMQVYICPYRQRLKLTEVVFDAWNWKWSRSNISLLPFVATGAVRTFTLTVRAGPFIWQQS